jgi:hypothetical protein
MSQEDLDRRVGEQERIHSKGGPCDQSMARIWEHVESVGKRVSNLEIKMYVLCTILAIAGNMLAQLIGKRIGL